MLFESQKRQASLTPILLFKDKQLLSTVETELDSGLGVESQLLVLNRRSGDQENAFFKTKKRQASLTPILLFKDKQLLSTGEPGLGSGLGVQGGLLVLNRR